jgi:hypothetical protein
MWIRDDRTFGMVARYNPESLVEESLLERIDQLPDLGKVRLLDALGSYEDAIGQNLRQQIDTLDDPEENDLYRELDIPDEFILRNDPHEPDLFELLRTQISQTPPRWQLERIFAPIEYLYNSGPSARKIAKLRKKLAQEAERGGGLRFS